MSLFSKPEPQPGPGPPPNQNNMQMYYRSEPEPPRAPPENPLKFAILLAGTVGIFIGLVLHICGITTPNWSVEEMEDIPVTFKNQETNETKNLSIRGNDFVSPWKSCSDGMIFKVNNLIKQDQYVTNIPIGEELEQGVCRDIFISDGCRDYFASWSVEGKCTKYSSVRVFSYIGVILGTAALLSAILSIVTAGKYQQGIALALITAAFGLAASLSVFIALCIWEATTRAWETTMRT